MDVEDFSKDHISLYSVIIIIIKFQFQQAILNINILETKTKTYPVLKEFCGYHVQQLNM